jgi:DNA topoisomerase-1
VIFEVKSGNLENLKLIDESGLCISRKKYGKGFQYHDEQGQKITDARLLRRLKSVVIPPMWDEVMICKWDDGHIQATGRDQKGRKQYIYHSEWERHRQREKFARMVNFGRQLPRIRQSCYRQVAKQGWRKEKVLALMVLILDETGIRIGNARYAKENKSYGLSTLRRKHLVVEDEALLFQFKGKSHQERHVMIEDEELVKLIKRSAEHSGYELFRYQDKLGGWRNIDSEDINQYIQDVMQAEFTSKDFRTWVATRLAVECYPNALEQKSQTPKKKFTNILIRLVADELGNTPTICRNYYVHPEVMRLIDQQNLPELARYRDARSRHGHSAAEKLVLDVIN